MLRRWHACAVLCLLAACGAPTTVPPDDAGHDAAAMDAARTDGAPSPDAPECATASDCDDDLFCNGAESCSGGRCMGGTAPCAAPMCSESTDACSCATPDADGDGSRAVACGGSDCDDDDPRRYPGHLEVCDAMNVDEDCDAVTYGFRDADGDGAPDARCCNTDAGGAMSCGDDCNDMRPGVGPTATEVCDGFDNDCDSLVDEGVLRTYYVDGDGDGYGLDAAPTNLEACFTPTGYADRAGDCDDGAGAIHPGLPDVCDAAMVDDDCSGVPNDPPSGCSCTGTDVRDCLAAGVCMGGVEMCSGGAWGTCSITPVTEVCDGRDEDCDGTVDDGVQITCFADGDLDGYPVAGASATLLCPASGGFGGCPTGFTTRVPIGATLDCDDTRFASAPNAAEVCNGLDDDCDGTQDEMLRVACYLDVDNDTYAAAGAAETMQCSDSTRTMTGLCPLGWTNRLPTSADCDDVNPSRSPASVEICDTIDQDCDALIDEGVSVDCYPDTDGDSFAAAGATTSRQCRDASRPTAGFCPITYTDRAPTGSVFDCAPGNAAIHPAATENCSSPPVDEDCDGLANPPSVCACDDGMVRSCTLPGVCASGSEQCSGGAWGACNVSPTTEVCDGRDEDCDGTVDDGLTVVCYADGDNDTYAATTAGPTALCPVAGRASVGGCPVNFTNRAPASSADCNDGSASVNPGVMEVCADSGAQVDEDCDMSLDEGLRVTCYTDADGDTYAPASATPTSRCRDATRPSVGYCPAAFTDRTPGPGTSDCNDGSGGVSPGAAESCDRVDSNCSSSGGAALDEDADNDGHAPIGATCTGGFPRDDCRDDNGAIYPGRPESCDRIDSNCSSGGGVASDEDADGDGHGPPGAGCTGGFRLDDCADNNANVFTGQTLYFGTPYCVNGATPFECSGSVFYCDGPGACPPVCGGCAPLVRASYDYDCSGTTDVEPVQTCTTGAGMSCFTTTCRSGPTTAGTSSNCGTSSTRYTCTCNFTYDCVSPVSSTGRRACR